MFDVVKFKENRSIFYYLFGEDVDFQNAINEYIENDYVKSYFDSSVYKDEILRLIDIKFGKFNKNFEVEVSVLDSNICIDYVINLDNLDIIKTLRLFSGEYANSSEFEKAYAAYKSLDTMISIFIKSNFIEQKEVVYKKLDEIKNAFEKTGTTLDSIVYEDEKDILTIAGEGVVIEINNFIEALKNSELDYTVSGKKLSSSDIKFINYIIETIISLL